MSVSRSAWLAAFLAVTGVSFADVAVGILDSESVYLGCGYEFPAAVAEGTGMQSHDRTEWPAANPRRGASWQR